jgi:cell pole-organizing protein PopZ
MESQNKKTSERPLEKLYEEIVEKPFKKDPAVVNIVNENSSKKINIDESNKSFSKDEINNLTIDKIIKPAEEKQSKVVYHKEQENSLLNNSNNNQVNTENSKNNTKNLMENFNDEPSNNSSNVNNKIEINSSNIIEKIDHKLIHQETIYQANDSIKKLIEAKNMIKNVNNFAQNETLSKIAISLMEPKLEKWLNENLPNMVENIVRQEIDKIMPKD